MAQGLSYGLTEISTLLQTPQHRLIHLCEKGVVEPELSDASGRGSSRRFSARNVFEFALALRLKEQMVPLASAQAILYVLRQFETRTRRKIPGFMLPASLRVASAPELRVILSDGDTLFFALGKQGKTPRLFGGTPLGRANDRAHLGGEPKRVKADASAFGWPEGSSYSRTEINVTQVARDLPLD